MAPYEYRPRNNVGLWVAIAALAITLGGAALHFYAEVEVLQERVTQLEQQDDQLDNRMIAVERAHHLEKQ